MVLFGAYHTAERFHDDDRKTSNFPGPGSYPRKSEVEGAPVPRYAEKLVEDGCLRPDGSPILFRERDSWVRGGEGPKGLTSLHTENPFTSPTLYRTDAGERFVRAATPAAFFDTLEARYLNPSKRCLTPDHERAAKGIHSPGPAAYYPFYNAWDFAPPEAWDDVNKTHRSPRRGFNAKMGWGDATMPRPPVPALAAEVPTSEERAWMRKRRGSIRPSTSPRCMWVTGVNTRRGLQAWGDLATKVGPMNVGRAGDCAPRAQSAPRRGPGSERRGPVHSCEARATSPRFREVRYLDHELMRRGAGAGRDTPGPGSYNVRPRMVCGTAFAAPRSGRNRPSSGGSRATTITATIDSFRTRITDKAGEDCAWRSRGRRHRPFPPGARPLHQRFSAPLQGKESPGPVYNWPSDFDVKHVNKKMFHPPPCHKSKTSGCREGRKRGRRRGPALPKRPPAVSVNIVTTDERYQCRPGMVGLSEARQELHKLLSKSSQPSGRVSAVPVNTVLGRGFLLAVRADGMSFVRFPWGVLYTKEALSWGSVNLGENPAAALSEPTRAMPLLKERLAPSMLHERTC